MIKLAIHGGEPVRKELLYLTEPLIEDSDIQAVTNVLKSKWIREGKRVKQFEEEFSAYIGTKFAVAVSSGTAALHTACASCGIKRNDEVIVPSFTHISTANAALYVGANPIFAEIDPITFTLDPDDVEKRITKKTKAIIVVHWAGHPANMDAIMDIADDNELIVIEDSCQALGAIYKSKKIGSFGSAACFSFYPSKIITTGEGGMIVTDDKKIYENAMLFRNYGQSWEKRFEHVMLGYNYRISEIQAALGLTQLNKVERIINLKNRNAFRLSKELEYIEGIYPPSVQADVRHVFMHYMVRVDEEIFGESRDFLVDALNKENIQARVYIPPVHLQPYYKEKFDYKKGVLPITEGIAEKVMTLPCSATMKLKDVDDIVKAILKIQNN